jgi:hypothetical protein
VTSLVAIRAKLILARSALSPIFLPSLAERTTIMCRRPGRHGTIADYMDDSMNRGYRRMAHARNIKAMSPAPTPIGVPAVPDSPEPLRLPVRKGRLGARSESQ